MKYQVGNWLFDTNKDELSCGDSVERPRFKVLQLLTCLVENRSRVVTRNELIDLIWDGNHLVGDKALNSVVYSLRNLLNVSKEAGNAIETVPKRGYRLTIDVAEVPELQENVKPFAGFMAKVELGKASVVAGLMLLSSVFVGALAFNDEPGELTAGNPVVVVNS